MHALNFSLRHISFLVVAMLLAVTGGTLTHAQANSTPKPESTEPFPVSLSVTDHCGVNEDSVMLPTLDGILFEQGEGEVTGQTTITPDTPIDVVLIDGEDTIVVRTLTWENLDLTDQPCGAQPTAVTTDDPATQDGAPVWPFILGAIGILALVASVFALRATQKPTQTESHRTTSKEQAHTGPATTDRSPDEQPEWPPVEP